MRSLAFLLFLTACAGHVPSPAARKAMGEKVETPKKERRDGYADLPNDPSNRLRYWQYGCPEDAETRNLEVIQLGETDSEKRRQGKVARWEVVCGDKILRCSQRHVLRCVWASN